MDAQVHSLQKVRFCRQETMHAGYWRAHAHAADYYKVPETRFIERRFQPNFKVQITATHQKLEAFL